MSNQGLKSLALACKALAIATSVVLPMLVGHRWGINPIADVQVVGLAILSLTPNRWLVFSRITFVVFLLLTLFPFRVFFHVSAFKGVDLGVILPGILLAGFLFVPLPLSLVLSRKRVQRGDRFMYA
ncbi:MAG TPA: hypothetical protein VIK39_00340 [Candidatus Angelobacter sp.]